jgi:hypothetical protein
VAHHAGSGGSIQHSQSDVAALLSMPINFDRSSEKPPAAILILRIETDCADPNWKWRSARTPCRLLGIDSLWTVKRRRVIYHRFALLLLSVTESVCSRLGERETPMPKNSPPPICPKCSMPMRFVLVKTGGRKFRCVDCDVAGLLKLPEFTQLLTGELRHLG